MKGIFRECCRVLICTAAVTAAGCGSKQTAFNPGGAITNPVGPSATSVTSAQSTPTSFTVAITDGWTGAAVPGARVTTGQSEVIADARGTIHATISPGECLALDILADGFLPRHTCAAPSVTLWPVANEAEVEATRRTAFHYDRLTDQAAYALDYGVVLEPEVLQKPGAQAVWAEASAQIRAATRGRLSIPLVPSLKWDEGYLVSNAATPPVCAHGWFTWNFSAARFCWNLTTEYFVTNVTVDPEGVDRLDVAMRALLYSYALNEHALPGLMNATQPAAELSLFERKTLHMMSLRWGTPVTWPDSDKTGK
jgi:hypothetical protein